MPGLSGGFVFDDFNNLKTLGDFGRIDNLQALCFYLTSGIADPTGRPVALASFLLDARNWPADPLPFKRTNLVIHLLNGALLLCVISRLERRLDGTPHAIECKGQSWVALLAAFLWLAHPLFVSTTLYVVQRHAMLPFTFTMLALLCWDLAYTRHAAGRIRAGWAWGILGVGMASLLAGLSKANGFLAPLLVVLAAWLLYEALRGGRPAGHVPSARRNLAIIAVPAALSVALIALQAPSSLDYTGLRSFTLGERLLSQPRVIWEYLGQLLLPRSGGGGVFVEGFPKSTGLWEPLTTLPAMLALIIMALAALTMRQRQPVAAFAVLFFLAAQLMESSVIMLELYFEHRNYLPAAFLFWPIARWLIASDSLAMTRRVLTLALPTCLLLLCWQRAQVWGNSELLTAMSADSNPESARAQILEAGRLADAGQTTAAANLLRSALASHGATTDLAFNLVGIECRSGRLSAAAVASADSAVAAEQRWHQGVIAWLSAAMDLASSGKCLGLGLGTIREWLATAERNPESESSASRKQNLLHLLARHALLSGEPESALKLFNEALLARPNPDTALTQAAALGRAGQSALGLLHLDYYDGLERQQQRRVRSMQDVHAWLVEGSDYYQRELAHLRGVLAEQLETGSSPARAPAHPHAGDPDAASRPTVLDSAPATAR
jgi:hypothetical protein